MNSDTSPLSDLRREIDRIDDALHDLLMRRAAVVEQVRTLKRGSASAFYRPAREAEVLRRLVARHRGTLPRALIVRLWREAMSALVRAQGPFAVAVWDGDHGAGYWDIARDHFGGLVPMTRHGSARGVMHAIARGHATVGVLPLPEDGEPDPWWPALAAGKRTRMRICARLPFVPGGNGQGAGLDALVVGAVPLEPSGDDRSCLLVEGAPGVSRASLGDSLGTVGLAPLHLAGRRQGSRDAPALYLVEVAGIVGDDDRRLGEFAATGRTASAARVIGGYAVPLVAAELDLGDETQARER